MSSHFKNVLFSAESGIATITINRPDKLNTLSMETLHELREAVKTVLDRAELRAAVLTGAGEKAFSAGADVSEFLKLSPLEAQSFAEMGQAIFGMIESGGKPFVAAVNGYALGGGCELALSCAIRMGSENARLAQPEIKLGIVTGFGGSQRLFRIVGKGRAAEICLLGEQIDAKTAFAWGLLNHVVPQSRLMEEANMRAKKLASYAPVAVKFTLEALNRASDLPLDEGLSYEAKLFGLCFATEDMREGVSAFLEKRKAEFKGR